MSYQIPDRQEEINWLFREYLDDRDREEQDNGNTSPAPSRGTASRTPEEVIELLCKDPDRKAIFGGENLHYASDSEADGRMFSNLAYFAERDTMLMREVAETSGRNRSKWREKRRHTDWLGWELDKAADRQTETIDPKRDGARLRAARQADHVEASRNGHPDDNEGGEEALPRLLDGSMPLADKIAHGVEPPDELEPGVLLKAAVHVLFSGAGTGKSWFALWLALQAMKRQERVLYLDYENGVRIVTERFAELGADPEKIDEYVTYFPEPGIIGTGAGKAEWEALLDHLEPDLILIDGWASSLAESDLDENEASDIEIYNRAIFAPARSRGATVVMFDHPGHDHERPRGSSRKKQAVDVMWALNTFKKFDRNTVGATAMLRKKDREAWLPETVTFSLGGSDEGFVFKKSAGTFEDFGDDGLRPSERKALDALVRLVVRLGADGETVGVPSSEWQSHCESQKIVSRASFFRAQKNLIDKGFVVAEEENRRPAHIPPVSRVSEQSHNPMRPESHSQSQRGGVYRHPRETEDSETDMTPASYDLKPGETSTVEELWEQRQKDVDQALDYEEF